jgi:hypothetical protein
MFGLTVTHRADVLNPDGERVTVPWVFGSPRRATTILWIEYCVAARADADAGISDAPTAGERRPCDVRAEGSRGPWPRR